MILTAALLSLTLGAPSPPPLESPNEATSILLRQAAGLPVSTKWSRGPKYPRTYFGARYYSAIQGRFISPDAPFADQHIENPQSWNLYSYVRNNPVVYTDPTGRGANTDPVSKAMRRAHNPSASAAEDEANARVSEATAPLLLLEITTLTPIPGDEYAVAALVLGRIKPVAQVAARGRGLLTGARSAVGRFFKRLFKGADEASSATARRPKPRKSTLQRDWDNAEPGPNGGRLCPTCEQEVTVPPGSGQPRDWDNSHLDPPWDERKKLLEESGAPRKEVLDEYNRDTQLECPTCNRGRGNRPINGEQ